MRMSRLLTISLDCSRILETEPMKISILLHILQIKKCSVGFCKLEHILGIF